MGLPDRSQFGDRSLRCLAGVGARGGGPWAGQVPTVERLRENGSPVAPVRHGDVSVLVHRFVLPIIGRCHEDTKRVFIEPFQAQNLPAEFVLDERSEHARFEVRKK